MRWSRPRYLGWRVARPAAVHLHARRRLSSSSSSNILWISRAQSVEVVRPSLHHVSTLRQTLRAPVGATALIALGVRELQLTSQPLHLPRRLLPGSVAYMQLSSPQNPQTATFQVAHSVPEPSTPALFAVISP